MTLPRATCVVPARLPGESQDPFAVRFLLRFYAGKGFLPATPNPEFSKNRFARSGSAPVARFGPPIEDRHRQTVATVCQRRHGTGVQLGFPGW